MKTNIQIFEDSEFGQIRTMTMEDGQVGFVGKDVAEALGYANATKAVIQHVDEEDKLHSQIGNAGQMRDMLFINESGLYALILSSKLPTARKFKHWVTAVVLPQIRKTGGFIPTSSGGDNLSDSEILSRALLIAQNTIELKNSQLEEQKPKVIFADAVTSGNDSILMRDLAKLLAQNGIPVGQNRLYEWMRKHGYIFQTGTRPIQKWVEKGLFDTTVTIIDTHHGTKERCTTKVTGKGQQYFVNGFLTGKFYCV